MTRVLLSVAGLLSAVPLLTSGVAAFAPQAPSAPVSAPADERVIACEDVEGGDRKPEFGCWNVGRVASIRLADLQPYWHLRRFQDWQSAEAAAGPTGIVVAINEEVWLSTVGPRDPGPSLAEQVAVVGPLRLPAASSYEVVLSYVVMAAGSRSPVHSLSGPKAWYLLEGEQCVETVIATTRASAVSKAPGNAMIAPSNVPLEVATTGTTPSRVLALSIVELTQGGTLRPNWQPSGACLR